MATCIHEFGGGGGVQCFPVTTPNSDVTEYWHTPEYTCTSPQPGENEAGLRVDFLNQQMIRFCGFLSHSFVTPGVTLMVV